MNDLAQNIGYNYYVETGEHLYEIWIGTYTATFWSYGDTLYWNL